MVCHESPKGQYTSKHFTEKSQFAKTTENNHLSRTVQFIASFPNVKCILREGGSKTTTILTVNHLVMVNFHSKCG